MELGTSHGDVDHKRLAAHAEPIVERLRETMIAAIEATVPPEKEPDLRDVVRCVLIAVGTEFAYRDIASKGGA